MINKTIIIDQKNVITEFNLQSGGFPSRIWLKGEANEKMLLQENSESQISLCLDDGRVIRPFVDADTTVYRTHIADGEAERIEFRRLQWADEAGNTIDKFEISLRHEFWKDGTVFSSAFFLVEENHCPDIKDFKLDLSINFKDFDDVRWAFFPRPPVSGVDDTYIQTVNTERFLPVGKNYKFENKIIPDVNFNCFRKNAPGVYMEFFVEGQNSFSGKSEDNVSEITWKNNNSININWNFQKNKCRNRLRPWQWQNQWGWFITKAPTTRHLPPLKMYHYMDSYQRYPTSRQMEKIAANDTDVLILHENWRHDPENGGIPQNTVQFEEVLRIAKQHDIRIALYIRGYEISGREESFDWFNSLLKKDFDGLYMDFGGPIHDVYSPDERFPGGRILFREHYLKIRTYRKRVGENGLLFSHTGPFFSAIGMADGNIDAYTSGEGEQGALIESRLKHEYFSQAFVTNGSMWTAAFPEYGTSKMIPFFAASGQYPHTPLGIQIKSSSLAHYREPGINDVYLRPLWKLWGLFRQEKNLRIFNDYNCSKIITHQNAEIGAYLMISENNMSALLILSNFANEVQKTKTAISWELTSFDPSDCEKYLFKPTLSTPGLAEKYSADNDFSIELEALGVAALLFTSAAGGNLNNTLETYQKPYPELDAADKDYQTLVEKQKSFRKKSLISNNVFLKVEIPALEVAYSDSLYWDLFDNLMELGYLDNKNNFSRVGWLSTEGFVKEKPERGKYILPDAPSPWVPLHEIFSPGKYSMAIRSLHAGNDFYSFVTASLSQSPDDNNPEIYQIEFMNEIEKCRSMICWNMEITPCKS